MKLTLAVLATLFCLANAVPLPKENIDLVQIPLKNDKELDILTIAESDGKINERNKRTIGILRELFPQLSKVGAEVDEVSVQEPYIVGSDSILETIRVAREINNLNNNQENDINKATASDDQQAEPSEKEDQKSEAAESPAFDELTLDSLEDDKNHDKRFLNFGGGAGGADASGHSTGGSAGGSGNFLFDIIRNTADRFNSISRVAGSAFRVVAGTESLDSAIKNFNIGGDATSNAEDVKGDDLNRSARSGDFTNLLVSGSSGSEQNDERNNGVDGDDHGEHGAGKGDGYTEGIPGPVTRLFVLANRGLSNLIQDLILRLAQTSERVVNFKARLITALI